MAMYSSRIMVDSSSYIEFNPPAITLSSADTLQAISRQTAYLQRKIQQCLDAQSYGLMAGLGQVDTFESKETHIDEDADSSQHRQRQHVAAKRPSLSTARAELYDLVLQLAELKKSESEALQNQEAVLESFRTGYKALADRRAKIESTIHEIEQQTEGAERSLADEEQTLAVEIESLESRLAESKARLSIIRNRRKEDGSRREAKLSSWRGALRGINGKIQTEVLANRDLRNVVLSLRPQSKSNKTVWDLPPERRLWTIMDEEINESKQELHQRVEDAGIEEKACEQVAELWKKVVEAIESVEGLLAEELNALSLSESNATDTNRGDTGMVKVMVSMTKTVEDLEAYFEHADNEGWVLMKAAIGAELEALKQGQELLQETLQLAQSQSTPGTLSMMTAKSRMTTDMSNMELTSRSGSDIPVQNVEHPGNGSKSQLVDVLDEVESISLDKHQPVLSVDEEEQDDDDEEDDAPRSDLLVEPGI